MHHGPAYAINVNKLSDNLKRALGVLEETPFTSSKGGWVHFYWGLRYTTPNGHHPGQTEVFMRSLVSALFASTAVLTLQVLTFSCLLGRDVISRALQLLFFGPLLLMDKLLSTARASWGVPIPATMFGGFPGWLVGLQLVTNWLLCSLMVFAILNALSSRAHRKES